MHLLYLEDLINYEKVDIDQLLLNPTLQPQLLDLLEETVEDIALSCSSLSSSDEENDTGFAAQCLIPGRNETADVKRARKKATKEVARQKRVNKVPKYIKKQRKRNK